MKAMFALEQENEINSLDLLLQNNYQSRLQYKREGYPSEVILYSVNSF